MSLQTRLDQLQDRLAENLRRLPGATNLQVFGSRAVGHADPYSDIDLQVYTVDILAARSVWPAFLEQVGPIEVALPLNPAPENTAFAVVFRDESYYHKVDIGLNDARARVPFGGSLPVRLWSQQPATASLPPLETKAYVPRSGTVGHFVMDELMATVRYVKARKRGHDLTCLRFLRTKLDRSLRLVAERMRDWEQHEGQLTTWDYKELDTVMPSADRTKLLRHLNWSEPRLMDQSCFWLTQQITELAHQKAHADDEQLPRDIIERHLAFVRVELDL